MCCGIICPRRPQVMASLSRGSQLSVGQTLEVVDKSCISQVRAARITRLIGRRLHVHYLDAPDDDGGFWCHENSPLVRAAAARGLCCGLCVDMLILAVYITFTYLSVLISVSLGIFVFGSKHWR